METVGTEVGSLSPQDSETPLWLRGLKGGPRESLGGVTGGSLAPRIKEFPWSLGGSQGSQERGEPMELKSPRIRGPHGACGVAVPPE